MTPDQTATPEEVRDVIAKAWARAQRRGLKKLSQPPTEPTADVPPHKPAVDRQARSRKAVSKRRQHGVDR